MNADASDSLDGRYVGALPVSAIMGAAVSLWVFGDANH